MLALLTLLLLLLPSPTASSSFNVLVLSQNMGGTRALFGAASNAADNAAEAESILVGALRGAAVPDIIALSTQEEGANAQLEFFKPLAAALGRVFEGAIRPGFAGAQFAPQLRAYTRLGLPGFTLVRVTTKASKLFTCELATLPRAFFGRRLGRELRFDRFGAPRPTPAATGSLFTSACPPSPSFPLPPFTPLVKQTQLVYIKNGKTGSISIATADVSRGVTRRGLYGGSRGSQWFASKAFISTALDVFEDRSDLAIRSKKLYLVTAHLPVDKADRATFGFGNKRRVDALASMYTQMASAGSNVNKVDTAVVITGDLNFRSQNFVESGVKQGAFDQLRQNMLDWKQDGSLQAYSEGEATFLRTIREESTPDYFTCRFFEIE